MKFQPHGSFQLSYSSNVVRLVVKGPWNKEAAESAFAAIDATLSLMNVQQFAKLIDARKWELGTPQFEYLTRESIKDLVDRGLQCEAYVTDGSTVRAEQIKSMTPQKTGYQRIICTTVEEAEKWLQRQGFEP